MARTRVRLISRGMSQLLKDDGVGAFVAHVAERVADNARASAPVKTGRYRDSIRVVRGTTDRAVARVVASAPHAMLVESRTGNLARAMESA